MAKAAGNGESSSREALRRGRIFGSYDGGAISRASFRVLCAAVAAYAFLALLMPIEDNDFWWHLKSGQFIIEHKALPAIDPFAFPGPSSHSAREGFLLSSYWLAQITYYLVYLAGGFKGLILFRVIVLSFMFVVVFKRLQRQGIDPDLSMLFLAGSLIIFSNQFYGDRPQVFSFIGAALLIGMMEKIREGGRPSYLLFPLMAIWSNLHGGFAIGDIFLVLFVIGNLVQHRHALRQCIPVVGWSLGGIMASFLNPNGYNPVIFSMQIGDESLMTQFVDEYQSTFAVFSSGHHSIALLWGMIILGLSGLVMMRKRYWPDFLLFAFTTYISVAYMRFSAFFSVALAPLSAFYFDRAMRPWRHSGLFRLLKSALAILMVGIIVSSAAHFLERGSPLQQEVGKKLPVHAAAFIEHAGIRGRMFNDYDWGGFLIWKLYPRAQAFIDGRIIDPSRITDYGRIIWGLTDRQAGLAIYKLLLDSYRIDFIVQRPYMALGNLLPLMVLLIDDPEWVPVYSDREAFVIVRNNALNSGALQKYQISKSDFVNGILINFNELIKEHPEDYRFYLAAGEMLIYMGRISEAERFLLEAKKLSPENFFVNRLLNQIRPGNA